MRGRSDCGPGVGSQAGAGERQIIPAGDMAGDRKGLGRETSASRRGPWEMAEGCRFAKGAGRVSSSLPFLPLRSVGQSYFWEGEWVNADQMHPGCSRICPGGLESSHLVLGALAEALGALEASGCLCCLARVQSGLTACPWGPLQSGRVG